MKVVFFGTPEFAVPSLDALHQAGHEIALVVAQPDRPSGRGMKTQSPAVAVRARELGLRLMQPEKVRAAEFLEELRAIAPDVAVVIAYGRILPQALLDIPRHGCINVHGSILPKYRGAAPIQRAIEAGEIETGVSIMTLDAEMDHGPVYSIARSEIGPEERTPDVASRLARIGAAELVKVLSQLDEGTAVAREQDHAAATHAPKIEKEEGRVRWSEPAAVIYNRFRAFWPWPGLSAEIGGETVKLASIEPAAGAGAPGQILGTAELIVATGEGALRLIEVQRPGKRAVAGSEFARSAGLKAGDSIR